MAPNGGGTGDDRHNNSREVGYAKARYICGCVIVDKHEVPNLCPIHNTYRATWHSPKMPVVSSDKM